MDMREITAKVGDAGWVEVYVAEHQTRGKTGRTEIVVNVFGPVTEGQAKYRVRKATKKFEEDPTPGVRIIASRARPILTEDMFGLVPQGED